MLMEIKFRVKKGTQVFDTICMQNFRVIQDMAKSKHISSSGEGNNSCFTSIKLHMICSAIRLRKQAAFNLGNAAKDFCIIRKEKKITNVILLHRSSVYIGPIKQQRSRNRTLRNTRQRRER
jgi:hypothetical protein